MPPGLESWLLQVKHKIPCRLQQGAPNGQNQFYGWQMTFRA